MKLFMLLLVLSAACIAAEKPNDVFEVGGALAHKFDNTYYRDNHFDHLGDHTSVFRLLGDFSNNGGLYMYIGHRFNGKSRDYETLIKYAYNSTSEKTGDLIDSDLSNGQTTGPATQIRNTGFLRQHDVGVVFRVSSWLFPYDWLRHDNLLVDLGAGVTTFVYDYYSANRPVYLVGNNSYIVDPGMDFSDIVGKKVIRSGLYFEVGLAYKFELMNSVDLVPRVNFKLGKIQDINGAGGRLVHEGPNISEVVFGVGVSKSFKSLF